MEENKRSQSKEDKEKVKDLETPRKAEHTPRRASALQTRGTRGRDTETGRGNYSKDTLGGTGTKEKTKRKKDSPAEGERGRTKRSMSSGGSGTEDEDEDNNQEELESEEDADDTIIEVKEDEEEEKEEEEWKRNMEDTVEKCNVNEVKKLLKMVMSDYRKRTKELEREKIKQAVQEQSELFKGFENMKRHVDESNEKWRRGVNEELGTMKVEIQQIRTEMEEMKGRGEGQAGVDEDMRKEVMELKKWREEVVSKGKKEEEETKTPAQTGANRGENQEQRNWKELE